MLWVDLAAFRAPKLCLHTGVSGRGQDTAHVLGGQSHHTVAQLPWIPGAGLALDWQHQELLRGECLI